MPTIAARRASQRKGSTAERRKKRLRKRLRAMMARKMPQVRC